MLQPLEGARITEAQLLELPVIPKGKAITNDGLHKGIAIVLAYTEAWLRGVGCIPLNNAMEDAATAEISRVQIWQWQYYCSIIICHGSLLYELQLLLCSSLAVYYVLSGAGLTLC